MRIQNNFKQEEKLKLLNFVNFEEIYEKSAFLEIAA